MSTALTVVPRVPDPRTEVVPVGFAEFYVAPVAPEMNWEQLDELEARLMGMASYLDSQKKDVVEFEKALRIVEWRRGVLLGPPEHGGDRRSEGFQVTRPLLESVPAMTASRYRTIARHWDELWPRILSAKSRADVTQAKILRLAAEKEHEAERCNMGAAVLTTIDGPTIEAAVRAAIQAEDNGMSAEDAAEIAGVCYSTYIRARAVVNLYDNPRLGHNDHVRAANALGLMNSKSVEAGYLEIADLRRRVYGATPGKHTGAEEAQREKFEQAFAVLVQVCAASRSLEVPALGRERGEEAMGQLKEAVGQLSALRRRIEETLQ